MGTGRITKRSVDALSTAGVDTFLWDRDLKGFGVKATQAGSKTYLVQYRMAGRGSKTKRWTIGSHGTWTPAAAREQAEKLLRLIATGVDPRAEAQKEAVMQRQETDPNADFGTYAETFLAKYGRQAWRPRTYLSNESNMRRWCTPVLTGRDLEAISRREITQVLDGIPVESIALRRSVFALMRKLFSWAVERGDLERSPCDQMKTPPSSRDRDRVLADDELMWVAMCASDLRAPFDAFVWLLIVTGQRRDEVSNMRWEELDRATATWTLPGERTKNKQQHVVPLNSIALKQLDDLAKQPRWPRSGHVLTTTGTTAISGFSKVKARLDRIIADARGRPLPAWRFHDLRRTMATNLQRLGVSFEVNEALLNHVSGAKSGVAGIYQRHDWAAEKRVAVERWADKLATMVNNTINGAD